MPTERMGPAARSFAADAHDCIMVRIQTDLPHTSVRREDAPNGELPSDDHADINRRHQTLKLRKGPSRGSSSLRVLRPQGAAKLTEKAPYKSRANLISSPSRRSLMQGRLRAQAAL